MSGVFGTTKQGTTMIFMSTTSYCVSFSLYFFFFAVWAGEGGRMSGLSLTRLLSSVTVVKSVVYCS